MHVCANEREYCNVTVINWLTHSGQRQVNYWGTQVPPIRSDMESSGFQSEARPLTPDPSENGSHDGDNEWAIDENNNYYDDSEDYQNASSEESSGKLFTQYFLQMGLFQIASLRRVKTKFLSASITWKRRTWNHFFHDWVSKKLIIIFENSIFKYS